MSKETKHELSKFPSYKDHLNKSFLEELSYKLWTTKGARFMSSKRLLIMNELSSKSIGFLSSYLIILGLISVYQISSNTFFHENIITFGSTTISILLLAFTLMEHAQDYKMRAHSYHECAIKISRLHNEVRMFQTMVPKNKVEKLDFCKSISEKYQALLENYPNHQKIDFDNFLVLHKEYYQLEWPQILISRIESYFRTKLLYHSLIILPPTLGVLLNIAN